MENNSNIFQKLLELEKKIDILIQCILEDTASADSMEESDDSMSESEEELPIKSSKPFAETGRKIMLESRR